MPAAVTPALRQRSTARATSRARSSGPSRPVGSSSASTARYDWGPGSGRRSGISGWSRAACAAARASRSAPARLRSFPLARPVRFPRTTRIESTNRRSETFWVTSLLAKRVRWLVPPPRTASPSPSPTVLSAASSTERASSLFIVADPDPDPAEAGGRGSMRHVGHLPGLPLPAVRHAPRRPGLGTADEIARVPEAGGDSLVGRIAEHSHTAAFPDLPGDLGLELKVVPELIDAPAPIRLHVDAAVGVGQQVLQRSFARRQAQVDHADHRYLVPTVAPHAAAAPLVSHAPRQLPRRQISGEEAVLHDVPALSFDPLVVEPKGR